MPAEAKPAESIRVRRAVRADLLRVAEIGAQSFSGLRPAARGLTWVTATFAAAPRSQYWVAEEAGELLGYVLWTEKGGFREEAVIELEQIAVRADRRGRGTGTHLVRESIAALEADLAARGSRLKLVEVTTGSAQNALEFYRAALGAEVVAEIPDYFRGTEYLLIARHVHAGAHAGSNQP